GVPWKAGTKWLPFLMLVTLLVFWRNGLYAQREFRGGVGRIVSSLVLVTVLTLAFGLGTGYPFHTFGLAPTALVIITALIGLFRASYDVVTKDVLRLTGARRRAVLVGKGEHVAQLRRVLGVGRSGIDYAFAGAIAPDSDGLRLPVPGWLRGLPGVRRASRSPPRWGSPRAGRSSTATGASGSGSASSGC